MEGEEEKKTSKTVMRVVINGVPKIYKEVINNETGFEQSFFKPRASGFLVCTHVLKYSDGTYEYHEDFYLDKDKISIQNQSVLTYSGYLESSDNMRKKAQQFQITY